MIVNPCVAVLVDTFGYYQEELVAGIEAIFDPLGICTVVVQGRELHPASEHYKEANDIYQFAKGSQFVGVIVASSSLSHNTDLNTIAGFVQSFDSKPLVSVGLEISNVASVVVDNRVGTENLIRHLVENQGHKRFVFMRGFKNNTDSILREKAVLSTLADYDLTIEPDLCLTGNFLSSDAFTRMNTLLAKRSDFDVVVAANDLMAFGIMKSLTKHGFRIPQDIAVTGFDDHQESYSAIPPLTTIRQPTYEIGQKAAQLIVQQLEANVVDDLHYLPTELIIRSSCIGKNLELNKVLTSKNPPEHKVEVEPESKRLMSQPDEQSYLHEFEHTKFYDAKLIPILSAFLKFKKNDSDLLRLFGTLLEEYNQIQGNNQLFFDFLDFIKNRVLENTADTISFKRASYNFLQLYQTLIAANQKELVQGGFEQLSAMHDSRRYNLELSLSTKHEEWYKVVVDVLEKTCTRAFVVLYDDFDDTDKSAFQLVVAAGSTVNASELPILFEASQILPPEFKAELTGKYYLMPLYVGREKYGFMFIDSEDSQMLQYEAFAHGLSIAIRNSEQLERLEQHTEKLEKANVDLATLAQYDNLTGLPNRSLLSERLELACVEAKEKGTQVALFFLDLDGFKYINDSLGHSAGDELLKMVGKRLRSQVRVTDTVARLGGDEFTIVVKNIEDLEGARRIAENIINIFNNPFQLNNSTFRVTTSIGIALFPDDDTDPEELMKFADAAMYKAKADGKNRYHNYSRSLSQEASEEVHIVEKMRHAVEREEFFVAYQPRVDLKKNTIVAFEALARWQIEDGTMISPGVFIPIAEKLGLIHEIGRFVLKQACLQAKQWSELLVAPSVAVNLSTNQLHEDDIVEQIEEILAEVGLEPSQLELEITESAAMIDINKNIQKLQRLRDMGIRIAIDDFGTAYSSLNYLKRLPVTILKIDQSFVKDIQSIDDVSSNTAVIRAVIALGKSMGFTLVAEGVETETQLNFLKQYDCDEIQGYLFGKPMKAEEASALLGLSEVVNYEPEAMMQTVSNFANYKL